MCRPVFATRTKWWSGLGRSLSMLSLSKHTQYAYRVGEVGWYINNLGSYWSCWWAERQDVPPHNPTSTSTERKRERDRARERTQYKLVYGQRAACINLLYTRYTTKPIYGQYMTCARLRAGLYTQRPSQTYLVEMDPSMLLPNICFA